MADFAQTMKDWRRMCADISCPDCEIFDYCEGLPNADIDKIQRIVTAWAAEHPEPVYPTWSEWLYEQGVLGDKYVCSIPELIASNVATDKVNDPIPADIARKFGLQPKEG